MSIPVWFYYFHCSFVFYFERLAVDSQCCGAGSHGWDVAETCHGVPGEDSLIDYYGGYLHL